MGCQEGRRRVGSGCGFEAETKALGGWQKSDRGRYQEALGAEARRTSYQDGIGPAPYSASDAAPLDVGAKFLTAFVVAAWR
jgi:hypothetical protein